MRTLILIYISFLLMPWTQGCVSKTSLKSNLRERQTIQNGTNDPMSSHVDSLADDSNPLIKRKLVKRGRVESLTHESGKAVVKICIDQTGKVISTDFDYGASSKNFARFAWKAEMIARQYVFEENVTAPPEECGHLTLVFNRG